MKNVAGYDLCKLYIGSLGTLGVIVEATFRALPLPPAQVAVSFEVRDCEAACRAANEAYLRGLSLQSAVATPGEGSWWLHVSLAGSNAGVERSRIELEALAGSRPMETPVTASLTSQLLARVSVLPERVPSLIERIRTQEVSVEVSPILGVLRFGFADVSTAGALQALAREFRGTCWLERCPAGLKQNLDVFGDPPPGVGLMRAIKQEFDPNGVLSPGRMASKI